MPIENPFVFYPKYWGNLIAKHWKLGKAVLKYRRIAISLKRDPEARNYTDLALTPVIEDEFNSLELFTHTEAAKSAVTKIRKPTAPVAVAPATNRMKRMMSPSAREAIPIAATAERPLEKFATFVWE